MLYQISPVTRTLLAVVAVLSLTRVAAAQPQCDGLTQLADNADQSPLLTSCARDENCTSISCNITDTSTRQFVQFARLMVLPCAAPMPQVQFQLLNLEEVCYSEVITMSGDVSIMVFSDQAGTNLPLGTLTTFLNHTSDSIGLSMDILLPTNLLVSLFAYTIVPLDLSVCPTPPPGTTSSTMMNGTSSTMTIGTSTTMTNEMSSSTIDESNSSVQLSFPLWLTILTSLLMLVYV